MEFEFTFLNNYHSDYDRYEEIYENIKARDYNDMHKEVGSLMRTDDQIYIDSTNMTIDEVADKVIKIVKGED